MPSSPTHLYIPINKCGNTSMVELFSKFNHVVVPHNKGIKNNSNLKIIKSSPRWKKLKKFTVVRDSIDRFISAINMIWRDRKVWIERGNIITGDTKMIDNILKIILNDNQRYELNTDFNQFIKRHTLPLTHPHYCLLDNKGKLNINYWIFLSDLKDQMKREKFLKITNIPINTKIKHVNKCTQKRFNRNDLTPDQLSKLKVYYVKDYEIFPIG